MPSPVPGAQASREAGAASVRKLIAESIRDHVANGGGYHRGADRCDTFRQPGGVRIKSGCCGRLGLSSTLDVEPEFGKSR